MKKAIFALGCFWKPEENFSKLEGIVDTEVGYCGGNTNQTTYEEVCSGETNHAEVIKIEFDEKKISYEKLIEKFFEMHDPTTLNKQGPDIGTQYRSEIFYNNDEQKKIALTTIENLNKKFNSKIVTKVTEVKNYTKAEDYHQKYFENNKF